ncbi:hypothetical protein [Streptomyces sp. NBC_01465]|uniref:hypothetical protein n=1 Tax=Streptomyces sp. NBC_01465 TaxID=2903878 RepID=UPI002E302D09|nr:hypothetical protein [Streptomyces sp. NBC_01465]
MEQEWRASVTADAVDALDEAQYEELHEHIPGASRFEEEYRQLFLMWRLRASDLTAATQDALEVVNRAFEAVLGAVPALTDLRVVTAERANAERDHPREQELMGYREAAEALEVSRQRVAQLDGSHPDFPRPVGRIGAGPVFTADSIKSFALRWDRSPGRRRAA